jgi:hypothetical protein
MGCIHEICDVVFVVEVPYLYSVCAQGTGSTAVD